MILITQIGTNFPEIQVFLIPSLSLSLSLWPWLLLFAIIIVFLFISCSIFYEHLVVALRRILPDAIRRGLFGAITTGSYDSYKWQVIEIWPFFPHSTLPFSHKVMYLLWWTKVWQLWCILLSSAMDFAHSNCEELSSKVLLYIFTLFFSFSFSFILLSSSVILFIFTNKMK